MKTEKWQCHACDKNCRLEVDGVLKHKPMSCRVFNDEHAAWARVEGLFEEVEKGFTIECSGCGAGIVFSPNKESEPAKPKTLADVPEGVLCRGRQRLNSSPLLYWRQGEGRPFFTDTDTSEINRSSSSPSEIIVDEVLGKVVVTYEGHPVCDVNQAAEAIRKQIDAFGRLLEKKNKALSSRTEEDREWNKVSRRLRELGKELRERHKVWVEIANLQAENEKLKTHNEKMEEKVRQEQKGAKR